MIDGIHEEQYTILKDYTEEVRRSNPRTTIKIKCDSTSGGSPRFLRSYVYWNALRKGFLAECRPPIGLDICHIKGRMQGQILTTISIDGNNSLYPITYAIVKNECTETLEWFVELLKEDLGSRLVVGGLWS